MRPLPKLLLRATSLVLALGLILVLDAVIARRSWPVPVLALLDEPAHLLTAGLILAAALPERCRVLLPWAVAGAVLIDIDHIPLYLWGWLIDGEAGRPVTHSLVVVLLLAVAGAIARGPLRTALVGLSIGVAMHLVRDVGTGSSVPLLWPATSTGFRMPYWSYVVTLCGFVLVALARWWRPRDVRSASGNPP